MANTNTLTYIGEQLVALCRAMEYGDMIDRIYGEDVTTLARRNEYIKGMESVLKKNG